MVKVLNALLNFLEDIPKLTKPIPTICMYCYSQSAIERAQSNMYNGKSRQIHWRHDPIRKLISTRVISINYLKLKDNIVDSLTKGLNGDLVSKSLRGMR